MDDERERAIVARLGAFANGVRFPEAEGIETEGDPERGWLGPYIAGTYLPVGIVGRNLADDWGDWLPQYQIHSHLTDAKLVAARDYYLAHADLFQAQRWRAVNFDQRYRPGGDGERLQQDVADLLAALQAARAVLAALVEKSPLYVRSDEHGWKLGWLCWYCEGQELLPGHTEDHQADCPWARAAALLATPPAAGDVAAGEGEGAG
jgi:hypothetical protein